MLTIKVLCIHCMCFHASKPNYVQIPDEGFCILGEPQTQEGFDAMFSLPEEPIIVVEGNPTLTVCVTKTGQTERTLGVNIFTSELDQGAQSRSLQSNVCGFYFLLFNLVLNINLR